MAVAFKASQTTAGVAGTSLSISYPASKASGDLSIKVVETGNNAGTPAISGYTLSGRSQIGSTGSATGATQLLVFTRTLDGSEGASASFTGGTDHVYGFSLLYTGHDTTTPVDVSTASGSASAATSVSTNSISSVSGDGGARFLACYAWDRDAATASVRTNSDFAGLTGETITNRVNAGTGSNAGGGLLIEEGAPAADSSGGVSHSVDFTSSIWAGILVRINPAAAGGPNTFTYSGSGGLQSGGSATLSKTKAFIPSGGLQSGGSATLAKVKSTQGVGGAVFAGAATTGFFPASGPNTYTYSASGGLTYSGAAQALFSSAALWTDIIPAESPFVVENAPVGTWTVIGPPGGVWTEE